ncbi:MAG: hypothetical protein OXJ52_04445 [Oligoflexia bacterium]|nr:hypothetical protein [Oligoflexia bacterium]
MKQPTNTSFTVWLVFFIFLIGSFILQNSFLSFILKPSLIPYILWPPLLFFFLYRSFLSSFILLFVISALSSAFLSLSIPVLFFIYLFFFMSVVIVKQFFYSKSFIFFASLVFIFSFFCPYFIEGVYGLSQLNFSVSNVLFYFYKSFMTCVLAVCVFPILKKYFPISEGI